MLIIYCFNERHTNNRLITCQQKQTKSIFNFIFMDLFLQIWGGSFYLTNKIFFSIAEGKKPGRKRQLKIIGWAIYILGVPAWVIILLLKQDWIAASIEFGGLPAMLFGLFNVYKKAETVNKSFDIIALVFTYTSIVSGTIFSIYSHHGIVSISQLLEMGVMIGFLLGSYFMAKNKSIGWVFFMLMNGSMGILMLLQNKPILSIQQGISLCFVIYGYLVAMKLEKANIAAIKNQLKVKEY